MEQAVWKPITLGISLINARGKEINRFKAVVGDINQYSLTCMLRCGSPPLESQDVSNSHGNLLERMMVVILRTTNHWNISLAKVFQVNLRLLILILLYYAYSPPAHPFFPNNKRNQNEHVK